MGFDVIIRSLILAFTVAQVACDNIRLTYYDSVTSQYLVSATPSGCYASLGLYPQGCLGNLSRCQQGLTVTAWVRSAPDVPYNRQADVILTTGGHSANSDGFFVTRRLSDQYTLGVAHGERLWRHTLRLEAGVWVMLGLTWDQAGGMSVFVDGLLQAEISAPEVRVLGQVLQSARALTVGTADNDDHVTGTCSYSVSDVIVVDNRTNSYVTQNNNLTQQLFQGCLAVAGTEAITSLSGRSGADLLLACRQLCQAAARTVALINGVTCACSNSSSGLVPASTCEGKWAVYLVSHVRLATPLTLSLDYKTLSTRGYTRPGEELSFTALVGYGLNPIYKLIFDDGTVMTTTSMPVSYSFSQAGLHVVTVSTQIGTVTLTNRTLVSVDSVDEGQPPQVVGLTVSSSPASLTSICALTLMDPQTSTCVLSFGNGDESPPYTFVTYGSSISVQQVYRVSGAYTVRAYCSNRHGNQSTQIRFLARQAVTSYSYITNLQSLTIPTFGDPLFYKTLVFKVNGSAVAYDVSDAGVANVDNDYLDQGVDNVVSMVAENILMDRRVLAVRKVPVKPLIKTDKTAGTWNLTVQVTFVVEANDHLWLTLDFGQGKEGKNLYTPGLNSTVQVDELVYYGALGVYTITATVSNELGEASARTDLSVEVPITEMSVVTYNVTSLTQPAVFQVSINAGLIGPRTVNFTFNFGDGSRQMFVYNSQTTAGLEPILVKHTYSTWGIYGVRVLAANNVSQSEEHVTVQVGENITYLDISTPRERISYGSQLELTVVCPTGSNVLYTVELGDGTQFSVGEQRPADKSTQSNVKALIDTSVVITHVYTRPGYYKVKVTASNEFGVMKAELCPTIVVAQPTVSLCPAPSVSFRNAAYSWEKPMTLTLMRSIQNTLTVDVSHDCPVKTNMTFSWTGVALSDASGDRTQRSIDTFCGFKLMNPTLRIEPLTLPFGLYALTVTVSPAGDDLLYTSAQIWIKVIQSEPVPVLDGDPVRTIMTYGTAIFDISGSYDPDLESDRRRDLSFHLFFMPEGEMKSTQKLTLEQTIGSSELITNRTIFRTSTSNYLGLYQRAACFNSTSELLDDLSVFGGRISFAANNFDSSQFSFAVVLWAERNDLSAMTYQIVEVRSSNMSLDDLGSLLDLAKNADPDTAIRLLGGAASAILTQDTSSAEAQEKLAASTEAVVNTLGSVAKRIDSPSQAAKCASAIKTMTSNKDIVSEGSRSSAAGAFVDLANGSSSMAEATVEDASNFAGECLGGLGNIFPSSPQTLASPSLPSQIEVTTVLLDLLSARSTGPTTPSISVTRGRTSTAPTPTTTPTTTSTTTSTSVWSTPQSTVIQTSVGSSLAPTVRASYQNNGDNFTISGVTVATLLLNASKDYTTPQPYQATTALPPSDVTTPLPEPVTVPIDERMFLPRTDPRPARVIALDILRSLADKATYRELFQYIFDDCLLFRKVMKSQDIQYNIPCLSTDAINMMKCDGDFTLQDRVFDIMTYYEHPDDIYEVYLVPLNKARAERDRARKATDKVVATAGLSALGTVSEAVGSKSADDDTTQRAFTTPRLSMKLAKVIVKNSTNDTEDSKQTMDLPSGGFDVPSSVLVGSAANCLSLNTMFMADSDNPFTYADAASSVGKGVLTLGYSCSGEKLTISGTEEPIQLWLERDATAYEHSLFLLLTKTKQNTWTNFNYHPVNITDTNSSLQIVLEPQETSSEYYVYVSYGERPNLTHYDFIGSSPNGQVKQLKGYAQLNDTQKDQLRFTVSVPLEVTSLNGTYWIGVKLKRGNIQVEDTSVNTSYTLLNLISGCRFWDEANNSWSSEGCQVGPLTTKYKTQCLCNHLTSFGSDAVVAPNTIDFSNVWAKFGDLNENAAVFATVISLVGLYVIMLVVLRHLDKKDLVKWGAVPLEDNLPTDDYYYQLTVQTGMKKNAGTDSQVRFIISGEEGDTGVRRLTVADGQRKHLARGSILNYVLSVDSCLGSLNFLRVWHDNSGKGKNQSWYLDQVQINDLQTGDRFIFLCDRWLAVEEDDGMVDRILPVAGLEDLIAFKQLFSTSARKKLANDHLWVSVFSRPTRSNFTRVQRLSCCMSLLFLTMITNAMWFRGDTTQQNVEAIKLGPFSFTLAQFFISFASTIIVFPPSFVMMTFFRKCRPKKNAIAQLNQATVKDSQKFRWRNITSSSMLWGSRPKQSRLNKLKESISGILTAHKKNKYADAEPMEDGEENIFKAKKKKTWSLPHWCIYIAWTLCFFSIVASGFFTILYSMQWGREKANQWLTAFLLSFVQSVIIVQPIKVLLLVAFIACVLKKPEFDDEELDEDITSVLAQRDKNLTTRDETSLSQIILQRRSDNTEFQPPDPEELARSRENRMMELKMEAVLKEILIYTIFLGILFFLSYQERDPQSYTMGNMIRNNMLAGFDEITAVPDFWDWLDGTFLPALYALHYADGTNVRFWQDAACVSDMDNRRVGVARIRQLRIKNDTCTIDPHLRAIIHHCRGEYNWIDDDTAPYLPFWVKPPESEAKQLKDSTSPFVYQNSIKLKTAPYVGSIATYKGGGYVILAKRQYSRTKVIIDSARAQDWLDLNTKAIFLEFTVYNANSNLFTSVTALVEFLPVGTALTKGDIKVFRLMSYIGGFGLIVLIMEVLFAILTLLFFVQCVKKVRAKRLSYFMDFWNLLEFVLLCLALTSIGLYAMKHILTDVAMAALHNRKSDGFVNFNSIALYDDLYGYVMSGVVFMATIQFLKLLQFNKKMGMLGSTVKLATKDLKYFSITFFLYFFAFTATGFLLFSNNLATYQNVATTAESMFAFALGSFDYGEITAAQPFWGPVFVFSYIGIVYIGLMNMFLTIIGEAFSQVKENVALQSNDYEIVEFMWKKIKAIFS